MSNLYMRGTSSNLLNLTTPLLASLALLSSIIALSTHSWLHTAEKMKNQNRTIVFGPHSQPEFYSKRTYSGLWVICISSVGDVKFTCSSVTYFPAEHYRPDDQDSTTAIPYTARKSAGYFLLSFSFMLAGLVCCLSTALRNSKKIFSFFSGVSYVVGGLVTLIGIINYISIFKAEVGAKLYSRSVLADPKFTYSYGYSFGVLILSFLLSEFTGICAIFQFIYHHQHKWDQIEKNNISESLGCKIIATLSNGTIKTLCDVKETNPTPFSDSVSEMVSSKLERAGSISPQQRLVQTNLSCSCVLYQEPCSCPAELGPQCYNPHIFLARQDTNTSETALPSSSLCSPNYPQTYSWTPSLKVPLGRESKEERRKKVTRHISIDETPITHTYHQNSLESSSQSSHSPSEESSGGSGSQYSSNYSSTEIDTKSRSSAQLNGQRKGEANGKHCSTLPSSGSSATNLKSSLSKTSSLKKSFNYKFETDSNLQQIVKQKRENCLQNGLSLSRESLADVFDDDSAVSQV